MLCLKCLSRRLLLHFFFCAVFLMIFYFFLGDLWHFLCENHTIYFKLMPRVCYALSSVAVVVATAAAVVAALGNNGYG